MAQNTATAEKRLKRLVEAGQETNRFNWAREWKTQGKKVIGLVDAYIPEEIIYAAGALPWHIFGTWRQNVPLASVYRPPNTCRYCAHVLESFMSGQLDFLDGAVGSDWDDDRRVLWSQWTHLKLMSFRHQLHVPVKDSGISRLEFTANVAGLKKGVEEFCGVKITDQALAEAIGVYNKMRSLLTRVYEMKKRDVPPLTGAETLGLTTAALVMPKDEYITELETLLPYLETRRPAMANLRPRLLVSADRLDNPAYIALIEDAGALVAMDDMDTGSRYFWKEVSVNGDPVAALAERYLSRPACPRMLFWKGQVSQMIEWVKEWKIDGVVNFTLSYSYPRVFGTPYLRDQLEAAGIPLITIQREYYLGSVGQLRTRVEAFTEILAERL